METSHTLLLVYQPQNLPDTLPADALVHTPVGFNEQCAMHMVGSEPAPMNNEVKLPFFWPAAQGLDEHENPVGMSSYDEHAAHFLENATIPELFDVENDFRSHSVTVNPFAAATAAPC